jgi:hypothetical protein
MRLAPGHKAEGPAAVAAADAVVLAGAEEAVVEEAGDIEAHKQATRYEL